MVAATPADRGFPAMTKQGVLSCGKQQGVKIGDRFHDAPTKYLFIWASRTTK